MPEKTNERRKLVQLPAFKDSDRKGTN